MKYEKLQQAHTLVDGYSQAEKDVLKPFLPKVPTQKPLDEIIEDVYEAYMDEEDEANSDRLAEIHFQLTNWAKTPWPGETAFSTEEYERLPHKSIVLDEDIPWVKWSGAWFSAFNEVRSNSEMAGEPRAIILKGDGYVQ